VPGRSSNSSNRIPGLDAGQESVPLPWENSPPPAFACLWTTGPDPKLDRVFRVLALRNVDGEWETFDRWCVDGAEGAAVSSRMRLEFGVEASDLADATDADEVLAELRHFLEGSGVVSDDGESFERWLEMRAPGEPLPVTGITELASLLAPGRLSLQGHGLVRGLGREPSTGPDRALFPTELVEAAGALVERFSKADLGAHVIAASGYAHAWRYLVETDPGGARRLALALSLVDRPTSWTDGVQELFPVAAGLTNGLLTNAITSIATADTWLYGLDPGWVPDPDAPDEGEPLPTGQGKYLPFPPEDLATLDDVMTVHLPELLAEGTGATAADMFRETQRTVARQVAQTLGHDELLLVHAPTGTGKTLAYLVPALLFASRHGIRVGVATYTRALQEQAMDREVPRALAALARAGIQPNISVRVLKGRENYVCWRALSQTTPLEGDDPEVWFAWTALSLFALTDDTGDLDRLTRRPPVRLDDARRYRTSMSQLIRASRARTGCCLGTEEKATCGAIQARRRADRANVIITNHSLVLARSELVKHVIFDECEHLHDGAHSAYSHVLKFEDVRELLNRLALPGRRGRYTPLVRLSTSLAPTSSAGDAAQRAHGGWERLTDVVDTFENEVHRFLDWRAIAERNRTDRETFALLEEYTTGLEGERLVAARLLFGREAHRLDGNLADLIAGLEDNQVRGAARMRRTLEVARADLVLMLEALEGWLPIVEDTPSFSRRYFHDVDQGLGDRISLVARPVEPHEVLGRLVLPDLGSGCLLSATTHIMGSFDAAKSYLGLDRAAHPADDEDRAPRDVRTFHADEVFDYERVIIGLPKDAPSPSNKGRHLDYVARFLSFLAERTRGRILVLFTNLADVRAVGEALTPQFAEWGIPLEYQGMESSDKEELAGRFRDRVESVLLGVDTFWYGADFPGETLEYLVVVRLPFGVPDRYHHAQCAAMGEGRQRKSIYLPRAMAKFRQGFGRLMRRRTDKGCVFVLDPRITDPRHRTFLKELPLANPLAGEGGGARVVRGETGHVIREALAHMGMLADIERRGLDLNFAGDVIPSQPPPRRVAVRDTPKAVPKRKPPAGPLEIDGGDVPY
tara:strand:- start:3686 stop:6961 length:3276 start_codon:yes stop_codon:yes gene_type:complete